MDTGHAAASTEYCTCTVASITTASCSEPPSSGLSLLSAQMFNAQCSPNCPPGPISSHAFFFGLANLRTLHGLESSTSSNIASVPRQMQLRSLRPLPTYAIAAEPRELDLLPTRCLSPFQYCPGRCIFDWPWISNSRLGWSKMSPIIYLPTTSLPEHRNTRETRGYRCLAAQPVI